MKLSDNSRFHHLENIGWEVLIWSHRIENSIYNRKGAEANIILNFTKVDDVHTKFQIYHIV